MGPAHIVSRAIRTCSGRPSPSVRFGTSAAMAASIEWRPWVQRAQLAAEGRFRRGIPAPIGAHQSCLDTFCRPIRPRSAVVRRCRSRRIGAVSAVPPGTAFLAWASSRSCAPSSASLPVRSEGGIRPVPASMARCKPCHDRRLLVPRPSIGHPPGLRFPNPVLSIIRRWARSRSVTAAAPNPDRGPPTGSGPLINPGTGKAIPAGPPQSRPAATVRGGEEWVWRGRSPERLTEA